MGGIVKKQLRVLIIALILNPMVWAISEGPHQPEYAKFEPVDASDMVSLTTGDFVYNLPLFEVPGPNGGYPINLAYHAGINPNQEASWVGLGWSLNVGAINRQINGYPDDFRGDLIETHIYSTGRIRGHGIGIGGGWGPFGLNMDFEAGVGLTGVNASFGIADIAAVTVGSDGLSVGLNINGVGSVGIGVGTNGYLNLSYGLGFGGEKNGYMAKGYVSLGAGKPNFGAGISSKVGAIKYMHHGGASFSFTGTSTNTSYGSGQGFSVSLNSASMSKNGVHTNYSSTGMTIPLPGGFWASFSYWESEVWIDETIEELSYGYLAKTDYMSDVWSKSGSDYRFDQQQISDNYIKNAQDSYSMNAWGISGQILPVDISENYLYRKSDGNRNKLYQHSGQYSSSLNASDVNFYLLGDNGGYFKNNHSTDDGLTGDYYAQGVDRNRGSIIETILNDLDQIAGFIVTTADGKRYEFLDYTKNIYNFQKSITPAEEGELEDIVSETFFCSSYPITWLLTAIKGPDYVDINSNDMDSEDFGFWVKISYSKTNDSYQNLRVYSNPAVSNLVQPEYAPIAQSDAKKLLTGIKNRKYIKQIETATHKVNFISEKDRLDNQKGLIDHNILKIGDEYGLDNYYGDWKKIFTDLYKDAIYRELPIFQLSFGGKIKILKLRDLFDPSGNILQNATIMINRYCGNTAFVNFSIYDEKISFETDIVNGECITNYSAVIISFKALESLDNGLGERLSKIELYESSTNSIIKTVLFNNNHYDLCPGTINSDAPNRGKLTLRGISFSGRDGKGHLPGYKFEYNNDPTYDHSQWHVDLWGHFNPDGVRDADNMQTNPVQRAKDVAMWSLNKITVPSGAEINIEYESDVYSGEPDYYEMVNRTLRGNLLNTNSILSDYSEILHTDLSFPLTTDYIILNANEASNINLNDKVYIFNDLFIMGAPVSSNKIYVKGNGFYNIINKFQLNSGNYAIQLNENIEINEGFGVFGYSYYLLDGGDVTKYIDGHRVKTISIFDPITNKKNVTNYQYIYSQSQTGSGYSETMPVSFDERWDRKLSSLNNDGSGDDPEMLNWYDMPTFNSFDDDYFSLRTPPGILYGSVIVSTNNDDGKVACEYYTPRDVKNSIEFTDNGLKIVNNSPIHGQLKKITHLKKIDENTYRPEKVQTFDYAVSGNDAPEGFAALNDVAILKTKTGTSSDPMGQIREFNLSEFQGKDRKQVDITYNKFFMVGSRTEEYYYDNAEATIHNGVAEKVTKTYKFDFRTGQPLASGSYQSDGSFVAEETVPAYYIYDSEDALEDRNMLTQTAMHKTYKIQDAVIDGDLVDPLDMTFSDNKVMNASASTWKPYLFGELPPLVDTVIPINESIYGAGVKGPYQSSVDEFPSFIEFNIKVSARFSGFLDPDDLRDEEGLQIGDGFVQHKRLNFEFTILDLDHNELQDITAYIETNSNGLKYKREKLQLHSDYYRNGFRVKLVSVSFADGNNQAKIITKSIDPIEPVEITFSQAELNIESISWNGYISSEPITWLKNDTYAWKYGYGTQYTAFPEAAWYDYNEYDYETDGKTAPDISGMEHWLQTSNITKYNRYSVPIEEQSAAGIYSSALYGYNDALPVAILANGRFSGEEDISGNATYIGFDHAIEGTSAHNHHWYLYPENDFSFDSYSGQFSRKIIPDDSDNTRFGPTRDILPEGESQNSKYIVTCWVKTESGFGSSNGRLVVHSKADGTDNTHVPSGAVQVLTFGDTNGQWEFKKLSFDLGQYKADAGITDNLRLRVYSVNNDGTKYFLIDDIRVYPADASMSTFTYDPVTWKVTTMTDANNLSTHYEYDDFGNLLRVLNHDKKVVSTGSKFSGRMK
jgi:hypothetical protein